MQKADIIIAFDGKPIDNIRDMSTLLKSLQPGQTIEIAFLRQAEQRRTQAKLSPR